ncbi:MAG: DUF3857 domain-containing protein [Bacteroidetes bacterium]|nr:DUF3857 domain-containing protein [Bacteroidota bacterium]
MKKLVALFYLIPVFLFAQKAPAKFGDIPMEDMTMKVYPLDSSASAVVLFDYGVAYISVTNAIQLFYERHTRIKILKKEGLGFADVGIRVYHEGATEEAVLNLKGATYNLENNKIVETKMSKEGMFKEKFNRNFNIQKFTLPNVKEGSIIEYSYKISSDFYTYFPNWQFQKSIPVRLSEYWAMIPQPFFYEKYMQGYLQLSTFKEERTNYYGQDVTASHYIAKDFPAFKPEPYMTSEDDYVSKINFALSHYQFSGEPLHEVMGSWEKLNAILLKSDNFGTVINKSGFLKDDVAQITTGITDPTAKVVAISNYVKQNFEWDGEEDYTAYPLKKVVEKKKGSSGDLNLLLGSMLDKAGFEVDMVLLSTRDHGFIRQSYPMSRQFNYTVCSVKVGDKVLLLDATDKFLPYDVLPERCLNGQGLRISEKNFGWIDIPAKVKQKTYINMDMALSNDGKLAGKINYVFDGYNAQEQRENYSKKGEDGYKKDFFAGKQWTVNSSEFKDMKEKDKSAKATFDVSIDEHANVAGDVIYINPFVSMRTEENPFKTADRQYPVDYGSKIEVIYMGKITLPDGYAVDELPKSKVVALPENAAKYTYNLVQQGNVINITSSFQVNKPLFLQADYPLLKEFYNQVIAKQAEQIVLKKK